MKRPKVEGIGGVHRALENWNCQVPYAVKVAVIDGLYRDMTELRQNLDTTFVKTLYFLVNGIDPASIGIELTDEDKEYIARVVREDIDLELPQEGIKRIGNLNEFISLTDEVYRNNNRKSRI